MQTSRTRRTSATERFHREARRKRPAPTAIILGLIGAGLLVAVSAILFGGGPRITNIQDRIAVHELKAARLESEGNLEGAIAEYRRALDLARPHEEFRGKVVRLRAAIKDLESRLHARAAAIAELEAFLEKCESARPETAAALREEGRKLLEKYKGAALEPLAVVRIACRRLGAMIPKALPSPAVIREHIARACGLGDRKRAGFAKAIRMWNDYIESAPRKDWAARAVLYRDVLDRWARDEAHSVRRRSETKDPAEAASMLGKERPRFEGTAGMEILR